MSKPHVKTPPAQTPAGTDQAQDAAPAPTGAPDAALVQPAQAGTPQDEHHGRGGMYTVVNGQRALIHRTQAEHVAPPVSSTPTE